MNKLIVTRKSTVVIFVLIFGVTHLDSVCHRKLEEILSFSKIHQKNPKANSTNFLFRIFVTLKVKLWIDCINVFFLLPSPRGTAFTLRLTFFTHEKFQIFSIYILSSIYLASKPFLQLQWLRYGFLLWTICKAHVQRRLHYIVYFVRNTKYKCTHYSITYM